MIWSYLLSSVIIQTLHCVYTHVDMHTWTSSWSPWVFRQLLLSFLLKHPIVHPNDVIFLQDFWIGGRESSRGTNWPSRYIHLILSTGWKSGYGYCAGFQIVWTHDVKHCRIWCWWQSLLWTTNTRTLTRVLLHVSTTGTPYNLQMNFSADIFWVRMPLPRPIGSVSHYHIWLCHGRQIVCPLDSNMRISCTGKYFGAFDVQTLM